MGNGLPMYTAEIRLREAVAIRERSITSTVGMKPAASAVIPCLWGIRTSVTVHPAKGVTRCLFIIPMTVVRYPVGTVTVRPFIIPMRERRRTREAVIQRRFIMLMRAAVL